MQMILKSEVTKFKWRESRDVGLKIKQDVQQPRTFRPFSFSKIFAP